MIDGTVHFRFFIYNKITYSQITAFDLLNEGKSKTHIPHPDAHHLERRMSKSNAGHQGRRQKIF